MPTDQEPLASVEFELNGADFRRHYYRGWIGTWKSIPRLMGGLILLYYLIASAYFVLGVEPGSAAFIPTVLAATAGYFLALMINGMRYADWYVRQARHYPSTIRERRLDLFSDCFAYSTQEWCGQYSWSAALKVESDRRLIYVSLANGSVILIPRRSFHNKQECQDFMTAMRTLHRSSAPNLNLSIPECAGSVAITCIRSIDEWTALAAILNKQSGVRKLQLISLVVLFLLPSAAILAVNWHYILVGRHPALLYQCAAYAVVLLAAFLARQSRSYFRKRIERLMKSRADSGPVTIRLAPGGFWAQAAYGVTFTGWSRVIEVLADSTGIYLICYGYTGVIIPTGATQSTANQARLLDIIKLFRVGEPVPPSFLQGFDQPESTVWPPAPSQMIID